ncbi:DUF2264 domain-containing protein [Alteromonas oceani]|uniref:DUF2264 domain-containing protein n=1 Tax=Alteromonas oceani TaxID=2071609 RepID=A0ABV7K553_9ALTE|nr:DUF2264 domain-containing protein [Alteromonas oceani]
MIKKIQPILKKFYPVQSFSLDVEIDNRFSTLDSELKQQLSQTHLQLEDYYNVLNYFIEGIDAYKLAEKSGVLYPGVAGTRGVGVEAFEGFARTAPTLALFLSKGHGESVTLNNGKKFNINSHLVDGISSGVDPNSEGYWGKIQDLDQRAVEAGDIALTTMLLTENKPDCFNQQQLHLIYQWIDDINNVELYGGNWVLFRLMVNVFLHSHCQNRQLKIEQDFAKFKSFYRGNGWFGDGENGLLDYYNAWQMHYYLFWFNKFYPDHEADFIRQALKEFTDGYQYFFAAEGIPIFGRSAMYRYAAPAPLVLQCEYDPSTAPVARRALEVIWQHFTLNGGIKGGNFTQGYYGNHPDLMENYSGRGSVLWSIRSLTTAFFFPPDSHFWQVEPGKLPIETGDYAISLDKAQLLVEGDNKAGVTKVTQLHPPFQNLRSESKKFASRGILLKLAETLLRRPLRKENLAVKYGRKTYYSDRPFYNHDID